MLVHVIVTLCYRTQDKLILISLVPCLSIERHCELGVLFTGTRELRSRRYGQHGECGLGHGVVGVLRDRHGSGVSLVLDSEDVVSFLDVLQQVVIV